MNTAAHWTSLEAVKLIVSLLTPLIVILIGYLLDRRLKKFELDSHNRAQQDTELKKKQQEELERRHDPHIEFTIQCNFFGPQMGKYLAEFVIMANNKSLVRHEFREINLRVRGIECDTPITIWEKSEHRVSFPDQLFKKDIVPHEFGYNYYFVEPGVRQEFSFITPIDEKYKFILARAEFRYDKFTPHSIERMFEVYPRSVSLAEQVGHIQGIGPDIVQKD